jgi:hypothetical protein
MSGTRGIGGVEEAGEANRESSSFSISPTARCVRPPMLRHAVYIPYEEPMGIPERARESTVDCELRADRISAYISSL